MSGFQEKQSSTSVQNVNQSIGIKKKKATRKRKRKRCCRVQNCKRMDIVAKGYCNKHYYQIWKHGEISERTIYTPNEIIDYGDCVGICLCNKKQEKVAEALADKSDLELIKKYKWHLSHGYATTMRSKIGTKTLHQILFPENKETDHINRNPLDNRRCNLRRCSHQENKMNVKIYKNNSSGVPGVWWDSKNNKWISSIQARGKCYNLGRFKDKQEAINVRKDAERKYFEEFSPLLY